MIAFLAGFFQDPNGKSSMTRLAMFLLCVAAVAVALTWCVAALEYPEKLTTQVTTGFAAVLAALVTNGVVALYQRTTTGTSS